LIVSMVCRDEESSWFEGVQWIDIYLIPAIDFYSVPSSGGSRWRPGSAAPQSTAQLSSGVD